MGLTKKSSKKRIKTAWVEALKSGEYKRGEGKLHKVATTKSGKEKHSFCCLGVLCDLAVKAKVIPEGVGTDVIEYDGQVNYAPISVMKWAGLKSHSGNYVAKKGNVDSLADKNDVGHSFNKIADIIESNPKGLFV